MLCVFVIMSLNAFMLALIIYMACKVIRLHKVIAILNTATYQGHTEHWDKQGTAGANCPACLRASRLRTRAQEILRYTPGHYDEYEDLKNG